MIKDGIPATSEANVRSTQGNINAQLQYMQRVASDPESTMPLEPVRDTVLDMLDDLTTQGVSGVSVTFKIPALNGQDRRGGEATEDDEGDMYAARILRRQLQGLVPNTGEDTIVVLPILPPTADKKTVDIGEMGTGGIGLVLDRRGADVAGEMFVVPLSFLQTVQLHTSPRAGDHPLPPKYTLVSRTE